MELQTPLENRLCNGCDEIVRHGFALSGQVEFFPHTLGTLKKIRKRGHCSFCRLVQWIIQQDPRYSMLDNPHTVLDCRAGKDILDDNCISLSAFSAIGKHTLGRIVKLRDTCKDCTNESSHSEVSASLIRRWLSTCQEQHGDICGSQVGEREREFGVGLILVDVQDQRLVTIEDTTWPRYVALSYVWGKVSMLQTTRANLESLKETGALSNLKFKHSIAQVIRDAMAFVMRIDEQYLWVDALCRCQPWSHYVKAVIDAGRHYPRRRTHKAFATRTDGPCLLACIVHDSCYIWTKCSFTITRSPTNV